MSSSNPFDIPDPYDLLAAADAEPPKRNLGSYGPVIQKLKEEKRFTFREIAEWLNKQGVECDHNSVYREHTKHMNELQEIMVSAEDDDEEDRITQDEAMAGQ